MHRLEPALWDIKGLSHGNTDYFTVCVDTRHKKLFSKGQTADDKAIKSSLERKTRALRALGTGRMLSVQRELNRGMEAGKNTYQERIENNLQQKLSEGGVDCGEKNGAGKKPREEQVDCFQEKLLASCRLRACN